jgi:hypothetical protein
MKNFLLFLLVVGLNFITVSAIADSQKSSVRLDFTDLKIAPQAKLAEYPDWLLGVHVNDAVNLKFGSSLDIILNHPVTYYWGSWKVKVSLAEVGLVDTTDRAKWAFPYPTPQTCKVFLEMNHKYTLKFLGTLYAQGGHEQPHIEDFSCQLVTDD